MRAESCEFLLNRSLNRSGIFANPPPPPPPANSRHNPHSLVVSPAHLPCVTELPLLGSRRRSSPARLPRASSELLRPTPPPRCFPLLVPLPVPHGEPREGEGSIFVFDLLFDGGGVPRAWRAGAGPSRRTPTPRRLATVDHEAGPRQFLHLAANLVHLALHCTSLESAEALHFPPSAAVTIPAFAAQQPPLPGTTEQRERMHNYQLRWNFRHETSRAEEQQVSRGELWWQHKEQGRGAATARGEQQHRRREAGARTEQQHRRREAAARTEQQQQHKQGRSWRISSTGGGGSRCGGCSNSRRGGSSRSRSKSSRLRRTRELEEDELHRIVAGGPGDARGDHDGGAIPGRRS